MGPQWLAMFVYSLVWIVASAPHELRKNNVNTDLSDRENAAALAFGFLLVIVLCAPAYYWGLQLAWRYLQGR